VTWFRHRGDTKFCVGAPEAGSFVTLCNGRWPLVDAAYGEVERHANPSPEERCLLCAERAVALETERSHVHGLADFYANEYEACFPTLACRLSREIRRLRTELEARTNELQLTQRELADSQDPLGTKYGAALVEAIDVAQSAGRRGWLSNREQDRLRELAKVVPQ
jgi:hypothetical protein